MSNLEDLVNRTLIWGAHKGILAMDNGDTGRPAGSTPKDQCLKFISEAGETADAVLKGDHEAIKDGIGDTMVTLILLADLCDLNLNECLGSALDIIEKRTGKMVNGAFVKDA